MLMLIIKRWWASIITFIISDLCFKADVYFVLSLWRSFTRFEQLVTLFRIINSDLCSQFLSSSSFLLLLLSLLLMMSTYPVTYCSWQSFEVQAIAHFSLRLNADMFLTSFNILFCCPMMQLKSMLRCKDGFCAKNAN